MKAVQIVLDERLLRAADKAARAAKLNRSAFVREALVAHLRRRRTLDMEERQRRGYEAHPPDEFAVWEKLSAWPEE